LAGYAAAAVELHRYNADELDPATERAMTDFYATRTGLITDAIAAFQAAHDETTLASRAELDSVNTPLGRARAAIDRYLRAFEEGASRRRHPKGTFRNSMEALPASASYREDPHPAHATRHAGRPAPADKRQRRAVVMNG
jgi:hypothetical protein